MLAITADGQKLQPFVIFKKNSPKRQICQELLKGFKKECGCVAHPQMIQRGVEKAARHFVMQAHHAGFRKISWTLDKKSESGS
jgi:hypothetical protein